MGQAGLVVEHTADKTGCRHGFKESVAEIGIHFIWISPKSVQIVRRNQTLNAVVGIRQQKHWAVRFERLKAHGGVYCDSACASFEKSVSIASIDENATICHAITVG